MAKILDFFDGSQSGSVPTIGNIEASSLSTYPSDAAFESANGPGETGDVYINSTDNVIRYWNDTESEWQSIISTGSVVDAENIGDGSVDNTEFQYLDGATSNIQDQLDEHTIDINAIDINHVQGTTGVHAASAISNSPLGDLGATDVQAALDELQADVNSRILTADKAQPNGVASLDGAGKVPVSQLPNSIMEYQGTWNASTNTPTLADGVGNTGDVYKVTVTGSQDLGSGSISFIVGDYAIYNASGVWEKADTTDAVTSVNGAQGVVVLDTDDVSEGSTNLYFTNTRAKTAVVDDSISDGVTDKAPSQNAVFDALANKQDTGSYITALTGDVTATGPGSSAASIASNSVTNTKLADMATQTIKGRTSGGTGDPEDLSATQATAILDSFVGDSGSGGTKGLVPAPAIGDATKFLRGDGTFQTVGGAGANTALSNLASVDLNENLTTSKASALQINHTAVTQNVSMSTANNGAGSSGGISLTTGTATGTRGDVNLSGRLVNLTSASGVVVTGNCVPAASVTYNLGSTSALWNIVYPRFVLGRSADFAVGSDYNTGFPALFQTGHSGGATATGALTVQSGDALAGGTGGVGAATIRAGDTLNTSNTNAAGVITVRGGNAQGTGAPGSTTISGGSVANTTNTNAGGALNLISGGTNNTSGTPTTGAVNISSATPTGTNCSSGNINITPGTPTGTGTRGKLIVNGLMMKLPTGTTNPTGVDNGDAYFNTSTSEIRTYNGGTWKAIGDSFNGQATYDTTSSLISETWGGDISALVLNGSTSEAIAGYGQAIIFDGDDSNGALGIFTRDRADTLRTSEMYIATGQADNLGTNGTGNIYINTGGVYNTSSQSGRIDITTGTTIQGTAGSINLTGGNSSGSGSGNGGSCTLTAGGSTNGQAGEIIILAGSASGSGAGGDVLITAGNSVSGTKGDITLTSQGDILLTANDDVIFNAERADFTNTTQVVLPVAAANPSSPAEGSCYAYSSGGTYEFRVYLNGGWRSTTLT